MGILYLLTFANGKQYIGVTESDYVSRRMGQHRYQARRGSRLPIYCAWRAHGEPSIEVLGNFSGPDLYAAEIEAIAAHKTQLPNGYNILAGGQRSPALCPDVQKKISEALSARYANDPALRDACRARLSDPERRKKIAAALTGKKLSEAAKDKIRQANLGKKADVETRAKMSKAHTGKKYSEETLERMRQAARARMQTPEGQEQRRRASLAGGEKMKQKAKDKQGATNEPDTGE